MSGMVVLQNGFRFEFAGIPSEGLPFLTANYVTCLRIEIRLDIAIRPRAGDRCGNVDSLPRWQHYFLEGFHAVENEVFALPNAPGNGSFLRIKATVTHVFVRLRFARSAD